MTEHMNGRPDPERQKFERGILEHYSHILGFIRSLSGSRAVAEDIAQETMVRALEHQDKYSPGTNLKAWLFTIARNEFYSNHRRAKTVAKYAGNERASTSEVSESIEMPEAEAVYELRQLLGYLPLLAQEQADALVLTAYLGMDYEEAAEITDCAIGTIKSRVSRARQSLFTLMESRPPAVMDLRRLQAATSGIPKGHRLYPLAKAYEDLYGLVAATEPSQRAALVEASSRKPAKPNASVDDEWVALVASGALDAGQETMQDLMAMDPSLF